MKTNFEINKKSIIMGGIILFVIVAVIIAIVFFRTEEPEPVSPTPTVVNITESSNKQVKYTQYNNGDFSMKIPEGWMVETVQGANYAIRVYDPDNELYQIYSFYSLGGFLKNKDAKQYYQVYSSISQTGFEKLAILNPGTPDNLYKIWTTVIGYMKTNMAGFANFNFPFFFNFKVKEQFELNSKLKQTLLNKVNEGVIRASFTDDTGNNKAQGIFSVAIVDLDNSDNNLPYAVYNAVGITAPESEFINYYNILQECLSSIKFSEKYLTNVNNGIIIDEKTTININDELMSISQSFNTAWSTRQTAEDIAMQKDLDNTLGYERVYNVNTKEVYRAPKNWYNNYVGDIYKIITEDMYLKELAGIIQ